MGLHRMSASRILLVSLLLVSVLPVFVETISAQTEFNYYWVTVNPTAPGFITHSAVGQNWTISFQAVWTYGNNSGQSIENATVFIEVRTVNDTVIETLLPKTNTTGFVSFYYSSLTPNILTFAPTKLVTEDGVEWNSSLLEDGENYVYGFQSKPITIYWDTFDISLMSIDMNTLGVTKVSVNVTYLMIPQEGLPVPQLSNYSQYDYIQKYVHGANVTINGVKAEESSVLGVYTAEISTWLPTAYILVRVSQEGWPRTYKAFSFTHNANEIIWASATILGLICAVVLLTYHFVLSRKTKGHALFKEPELLTVGTILLIIASFISMYWTLVGVEGVLHGFDWMLLGVFGIIAFAFGLTGGIMSKRRKNFALTMIAVCFPLVENAAVVKYSLDNYQLAIPWIAIALATIISTLSGILIGRSDEEFS
jgi:hypothetical protein